jgi:6-phosphogluconolactonase
MLQFHPNGRRAYCVCELNSDVEVLDWDAASGNLTSVQRISVLPEGAPHGRAAQILFDRQGDYAYVANREDDFIASLKVDPESGKLQIMERTTTGGKTPRHIALDPTEGWLLVANQASATIAVFKRDRKTGRLAHAGATFEISHPQCLVFG